MGLCYELTKDYESALKEYKEAEKYQQLEIDGNKKSLLRKLIERVDNLINNTFLTAEMSPKKQTIRQDVASPPKQERSFLNKSHSTGRMRMNLDSSRVGLAIQQADEKMEDYLASMKNSFILEQ